jgi:nucleoside 2-deoxyribosyltransferase
MKIYFTAAISSKQEYGDNYKKIVSTLKELGHDVISEQILEKEMEQLSSQTNEQREKYYQWMVKEMKKADLLVAEVSFPSTVHVGHELTLALDQEKPVLALYTKGKQPLLFWGIVSEKFYVEEYDLDSLKKILKQSIQYLAEKIDTRFNFFISPKIGNYLDWIAKKKKLPRAVYLRKLIEDDMDKNKEYSEAE